MGTFKERDRLYRRSQVFFCAGYSLGNGIKIFTVAQGKAEGMEQIFAALGDENDHRQ
jgi:hypothetical protein